MATRSVFVVGALLCGSLFGAVESHSQSRIHLRASHRGEFLPEGTELVVLKKAARHARDERFQPEFIHRAQFPLERFESLERDRMDGGRRSAGSYLPTDASKRVYFLYALTPDSTLYWSYSAQRDSLKFDVVSTGVMSVAPVPDPQAREAILTAFFRPRVTVFMPEDRWPERDSSFASADTILAITDSLSAVTPESDKPDTLTAEIRTAATMSPIPQVGEGGIRLSPGAAVLLFLLLAASIATPVYYARKFRNEAEQLRLEVARRQNSEEDFEVLKARILALEREISSKMP